MNFLDGLPFDQIFKFGRARAASYRAADGSVAVAPIDTPRFDHALDGSRRGLLVEGLGDVPMADRLRVRVAGWAAAMGTVVHELETPEGEVRRRAYYTDDGPATIDACLRVKGWHRAIGYVPMMLEPDADGMVAAKDRLFQLAGRVLVQDGVLLSYGDGSILEGPL